MRHPVLLADSQEKAFYHKLGLRLREFRTSLKINLSEASEQLGISRDTIRSYENGHARPPLYQLLKMCQLYAVHISDLL